MNTYLITGGAGFIGSNLADSLLREGHRVVVVDNFNDFYNPKIKRINIEDNLTNENYRLYEIDIENRLSLSEVFQKHKFDAVIHLAARAGVRPSIQAPDLYVQSNVLGTVNILECMKEYHVKKLVFASSSSVYGNSQAESFAENLQVSEPISPYAATKLACEQLCYTWYHLYGINVVALRFFTVYGPRQRPDLAIHLFVDSIEKNKPIKLYGDGSSRRDYTYIGDIVFGIKKAILYSQTGYEIINLGSGNPITLKKMVETIEKVLDKKATLIMCPPQLGDVDKTVCDWSKANRLLGYKPQTSFEDGIRQFVDWQKEIK